MRFKAIFILSIVAVMFVVSSCSERDSVKVREKQKSDGKTEILDASKKNVDIAAEKIKTINNLKDAYKGEVTASTKYAAYSKKAREEGYLRIALLFEAVSKSESIHAINHKDALEELGEKPYEFKPEYEVKSTKENLEESIKGEANEVDNMYPDFIRTANNGAVNIALLTFNYAYRTEQKHKPMYENALNKLNAGQENTLPDKYWVCSTCGNTYDSQPQKRCSLSMTPSDRLMVIQ